MLVASSSFDDVEASTPLLSTKAKCTGPLGRAEVQRRGRGVAVLVTAIIVLGVVASHTRPSAADEAADLAIHDDQLDETMVVDCTKMPNATDFPSVLQWRGGYMLGGKPWGGVLLTDRGQYRSLHGISRASDYDFASSNHGIVATFDAALASCEADLSNCAHEFETTCRLTGDYDLTLSCVEDCVESRFKTFHDPSQPTFDPESCDDPVLATIFFAPALFKSCLDPTYACSAGGVVCEPGCYECIDECGVESLHIQRTCDVQPGSTEETHHTNLAGRRAAGQQQLREDSQVAATAPLTPKQMQTRVLK